MPINKANKIVMLNSIGKTSKHHNYFHPYPLRWSLTMIIQTSFFAAYIKNIAQKQVLKKKKFQ
jgi:hypothetical protein